jgi:hypothetical protein
MNSHVCLSFVTFPILVGLGLSRPLTEGIIELGRLSEEVFRGDRLLILPFPEVADSLKD